MTTGVSSSTVSDAPAQASVEGNGDPAIDAGADSGSAEKLGLPDGYADIRGNPDIQFSPIAQKELKPREPGWFEEALNDFFDWLGDILAPIANALGMNWEILRWVLLAIFLAIIVYALFRIIGPMIARDRNAVAYTEDAEPQWQPDRQESLALLEDADRLAAAGRFDEAARLLLQRSVGQIAEARPDWVDPSSTARELAALPALSDAARRAFATISAAVERSLFALNRLNQDDWERARAAYAEFALSKIEANRTNNAQARG